MFIGRDDYIDQLRHALSESNRSNWIKNIGGMWGRHGIQVWNHDMDDLR
jgi:hypothetical protein